VSATGRAFRWRARARPLASCVSPLGGHLPLASCRLSSLSSSDSSDRAQVRRKKWPGERGCAVQRVALALVALSCAQTDVSAHGQGAVVQCREAAHCAHCSLHTAVCGHSNAHNSPHRARPSHTDRLQPAGQPSVPAASLLAALRVQLSNAHNKSTATRMARWKQRQPDTHTHTHTHTRQLSVRRKQTGLHLCVCLCEGLSAANGRPLACHCLVHLRRPGQGTGVARAWPRDAGSLGRPFCVAPSLRGKNGRSKCSRRTKRPPRRKRAKRFHFCSPNGSISPPPATVSGHSKRHLATLTQPPIGRPLWPQSRHRRGSKWGHWAGN